MPVRSPTSTRDLPGLQLTWLDGAVVAWQPSRNAYGGNIQADIRSTLGGRAASGAGAVRVARLRLPDGPVNVMCQQLDIVAVAELGRFDALDGAPSPSVAWFAGTFRLARQLLTAGRAVPRLAEHGDGWWRATWETPGSDAAALVPALAAAMPPVVAAGTEGAPEQVAHDVLDAFVDQLARAALAHAGWTVPFGDTRRPHARMVRQVAKALAGPISRVHPDRDLLDELDDVAEAFDDLRHRAEGRPVLRARLRLGLPPDEGGDWPLVLELVDTADAARWCSAAAALRGDTAALELVGDARWLDVVRQRAERAVGDVALVAPWLEAWAADGADGSVSIDDAAATLQALAVLDAVRVELISPASLTRRAPRTTGTARPSREGDGRFGAQAIVQWTVVVDGTPVDEAAVRRAAEAGADLVSVGGRWVQLGRAEARRALEQLEKHRAEHSEVTTLELLRLSAELAADTAADAETAPDGANLPPGGLAGDDWLGPPLAGLPDTELTDGEVPPGFTATLRPYQRRGLGWLQFLHRVGLGGCLADDMGLGKTPTTLAHLAGLPGPHLVVCPLSVVRNWEQETARFVPFARVMVHHGTGRAADAVFLSRVAEHDLVITTYQVAARDAELLGRVNWSIMVLDEAQAVKNPDTRTAKAVRTIPAGQRLALTGTPVENRLSELWSIIDAVVPGLLGSFAQFRTRFAIPIEKHRDAAATAALRQVTSPFVLRRTKADRALVPDLPDKVEQIAWAPLTREQASMYQAVVDQLLADAQAATGMRRRGLVLAALTRLKQICNHPAHALGDGSRLAGRSGKLTRFDELVTDLLDAGEQALVFTQFREMGLLLQRHLRERFGTDVPFLHGGVTRAHRDQMVDVFQSGDAPSPLLLVSLRAGGTGLNLTAASRVVHYDRWWNPAVEDQATDRAWRIGQQRSVFVHKLVCQGTIEERVNTLIDDKRALADAVVGTSGETWLSELSTDELRDLVVLDHAVQGQT